MVRRRPAGHLEEIGRYFIAARILHAEFNSINQSAEKDRDWISYLLRQMDAGTFDDFCARPVTFITYNYDRLIEERFTRGLQSKFGLAAEHVARYWTDRPVIHLHGSVGDYTKVGPNYVPFGSAIQEAGNLNHDTRLTLEKAASGIKIVHQAADNSAEFLAARQALSEAVTVFFLGFSYGRVNVDRLGLASMHPNAVSVCGCYGMTAAEVAVNVKEPFRKFLGRHPNVTGGSEDDCLQVLRDRLDLFVRRY